MKTLAALVLLAALCSGCTTTHISKVGDSFTVIRKTMLTQHTIADLQVSATTNGTQLGLSGYQSDEVAALAMAVEAAVRAGIAGAKP